MFPRSRQHYFFQSQNFLFTSEAKLTEGKERSLRLSSTTSLATVAQVLLVVAVVATVETPNEEENGHQTEDVRATPDPEELLIKAENQVDAIVEGHQVAEENARKEVLFEDAVEAAHLAEQGCSRQCHQVNLRG